MQRETSRRASRTFVRSTAHEKFKGYQLCVSPNPQIPELKNYLEFLSCLCLPKTRWLTLTKCEPTFQADLDTHDPKASNLRLAFRKISPTGCMMAEHLFSS
jgi:hypothetical protein